MNRLLSLLPLVLLTACGGGAFESAADSGGAGGAGSTSGSGGADQGGSRGTAMMTSAGAAGVGGVAGSGVGSGGGGAATGGSAGTSTEMGAAGFENVGTPSKCHAAPLVSIDPACTSRGLATYNGTMCPSPCGSAVYGVDPGVWCCPQ